MSFYVTLPSNSSSSHFKNNTLSNYFTQLKRSLKLEGEYEVGLAEIMYPLNWKQKRDGNITFGADSLSKIEMFKISFGIYDTMKDLFKELNDYATKRNIPFTIEYLDNEQKALVNITSPWQIEFSNGVHESLGAKFSKIIPPAGKTVQYKLESTIENPIHIVNALYIYTDIIEYQFVGDTFAPLLRVVGVDSRNKFEQYIDEVYTNPHYITVSRNTIDAIEIAIRDDQGKPIEFKAGKVLVKLHFRPKSYYGL